MSLPAIGLTLSDFNDLEERVGIIAAVVELSESTTMTTREICKDTGLTMHCVRG